MFFNESSFVTKNQVKGIFICFFALALSPNLHAQQKRGISGGGGTGLSSLVKSIGNSLVDDAKDVSRVREYKDFHIDFESALQQVEIYITDEKIYRDDDGDGKDEEVSAEFIPYNPPKIVKIDDHYQVLRGYIRFNEERFKGELLQGDLARRTVFHEVGRAMGKEGSHYPLTIIYDLFSKRSMDKGESDFTRSSFETIFLCDINYEFVEGNHRSKRSFSTLVSPHQTKVIFDYGKWFIIKVKAEALDFLSFRGSLSYECSPVDDYVKVVDAFYNPKKPGGFEETNSQMFFDGNNVSADSKFLTNDTYQLCAEGDLSRLAKTLTIKHGSNSKYLREEFIVKESGEGERIEKILFSRKCTSYHHYDRECMSRADTWTEEVVLTINRCQAQ